MEASIVPATNSAEASALPRDVGSGELIRPRHQPGYYPGYSTLAQKSFWDEATRKVILQRVNYPPSRKFFSEQEWGFWSVVFDHLLPQTDRVPERRIPIMPHVDHRLFTNQTSGYRFENMPQDRVAYGLGQEAIGQEASREFNNNFLLLDYHQQDMILKSLHDAKPKAAVEIWKKMSVHRFWQLIMGDAIDAYYSHPWSWDEIGFGGPAYPRAYTRLERGEPEPWEVEEKRYDWVAPSAAVSDVVDSAAHLHTEADQHSLESRVAETVPISSK